MIYCLLTLPHPHLSPNCWVSPPEYNIYRDTKIISQSGPSWPSKDYRPSKQKCFTYNQLMDYQLIQWRHPPFKTTINHYSKPRHFLLRKYFHCLTFLYRSVEWKELSILDLPQSQHIMKRTLQNWSVKTVFQNQFNPNPSTWNEKPIFCCEDSIRFSINIVRITFHQSSCCVGDVCLKSSRNQIPSQYLLFQLSLLMIGITNLIIPRPKLTSLITD